MASSEKNALTLIVLEISLKICDYESAVRLQHESTPQFPKQHNSNEIPRKL